MSPRNNDSRAQIARRREEQRIVTQTRLTISSAFPPPADLERYVGVMPSFGDELMDRWKLQGDHRMRIENRWVTAQIVRSYITAVGGFLLILTLMVGSIWLIATGHESLGAGGIILDVAILVGSFIGRWLGGQKSQGG